MQNRKIILVVEDEMPLRNALVEKLTHEGLGTLQAKNGEEGLEAALGNHPDLILLDIMMPKMDGMAVLANLRKDSWGKTALVIMLTNLNDNQKVADAMADQAFDYFVKSDTKIEDIILKIKEKLLS